MNTPARSEDDINAQSLEHAEEQPTDRQSISAGGFACTVNNEIIPMYVAAEVDTILGDETKANSFVVCGKDRPKSRWSGNGGKGYTKCGTVDIVAGRMGYRPSSGFCDPSFKNDAARIYISQRTDCDLNFGFTDGNLGAISNASAVVLFADEIRLGARNGCKIITSMHSKDSQGTELKSIVGVDIIAGNKTEDLQPMPKGKHLNEAMGRLTDHVDKLNGIVDHLLTTQMNFNESLTHHFHYSPWYGNATTPSDAVVGKGVKTTIDFLQETKRSLVTHKANLANFKQTYLMPSGCKYINSRWNSVN
jgi:hypothetical protein